MTTFTTIPDTTLLQDKPLTQSVARGLRDNPVAIAEGDMSAPRVLTKAINSQYIRVGTSSTLVGNIEVVAPMTTVTLDPDNRYDVTTYRFTPTVAGLYQVFGRVRTGLMTAGSTLACRVYKNGVFSAIGAQASAINNQDTNVMLTNIVQMNGTTDYIELRIVKSSAGAVNCEAEMVVVGLCEI